MTANPSEYGAQKTTQAQELLAGSRCDRGLQVATLLILDPNASWPHLYRSFEELKRFVEKKTDKNIVKAGFCSDAEEKRFTGTANNAEAAGNDARHRFEKYQAPKNPMSVGEARMFISKLLQATLRLAVGNEKSNPTRNKVD